jgi:hypothetical protein
MPRAVELRLRGALEEYVSAYKGDNPRATGSRGVNADLVKQAESLLGGIGGEGKTARETPGSRAAAGSPGRAIDSVKERAREMLMPTGANGAAAGDGEQ